MHQITIDLSTHSHFDQIIIDVPGHLGVAGQLNPLTGMHIALNGAVKHQIGYPYIAFYAPPLTDSQYRLATALGENIALDDPVDMQATGEPEQGRHLGLAAAGLRDRQSADVLQQLHMTLLAGSPRM